MEPRGPGDTAGPQQLTGNPPIGKGLFFCVFWSLRERLYLKFNDVAINIWLYVHIFC